MPKGEKKIETVGFLLFAATPVTKHLCVSMRNVGICVCAWRSGRNALDCLGQGGRDPLSVTLKTGIYSGLRYRDPLVEWAFWNDDFSGTSNSYTQSVCAYSSYSEEALPYTPCSSTAQVLVYLFVKGGYL